MKVQLIFKTPDVVENTLNFVDDEIQEIDFDKKLTEEEKENKIEELYAKKNSLRLCISKFVEYGEYCTIEIDTETGTAKVLEV